MRLGCAVSLWWQIQKRPHFEGTARSVVLIDDNLWWSSTIQWFAPSTHMQRRWFSAFVFCVRLVYSSVHCQGRQLACFYQFSKKGFCTFVGQIQLKTWSDRHQTFLPMHFRHSPKLRSPLKQNKFYIATANECPSSPENHLLLFAISSRLLSSRLLQPCIVRQSASVKMARYCWIIDPYVACFASWVRSFSKFMVSPEPRPQLPASTWKCHIYATLHYWSIDLQQSLSSFSIHISKADLPPKILPPSYILISFHTKAKIIYWQCFCHLHNLILRTSTLLGYPKAKMHSF